MGRVVLVDLGMRGHPRLGDLPRHESALILAVVADLRLRDDLAASELDIATTNILTFMSFGIGNTLLTRSSWVPAQQNLG